MIHWLTLSTLIPESTSVPVHWRSGQREGKQDWWELQNSMWLEERRVESSKSPRVQHLFYIASHMKTESHINTVKKSNTNIKLYYFNSVLYSQDIQNCLSGLTVTSTITIKTCLTTLVYYLTLKRVKVKDIVPTPLQRREPVWKEKRRRSRKRRRRR